MGNSRRWLSWERCSKKIGQQLAIEDGDKWVQVDEKERLKHFRKHGLKLELDKIKSDLAAFGVTFDNWFSETSLYEEDKITEALNQLQKKQILFMKKMVQHGSNQLHIMMIRTGY